MTEGVGAQISALKSAYATLSDVLVEETDACHNGLKLLKEALNAREREIDILKENEQRLARGIRSLESDLADARREALQVEHRAEDAANLARSTEISTREAIVLMQQQVAQLASRCDVAEDRAKLAEDRFMSAEHRASQAESRAAAAEERAASAEEGLRRLTSDNRQLQSQLSDVRARLEVVTKDFEKQFRELDRRSQQSSEKLTDVQTQISTSINSGLSAVNGGLDRLQRDLNTVQSTVHNLERQHAALKSQTTDADASLASDVAMLADKITNVTSHFSSEYASLASRVAGVSSASEEGRRLEAEERERRINTLSKTLTAEVEHLRKSLETSERSLQRVRELAEEHAKLNTTENRQTSAQVAALEASMTTHVTEQNKRLDESLKTNAARLDAMSNALHAFANVLNLGQVVIDPRTVLTKSMGSAGISTPLSSTVSQSTFPSRTAAPVASPSKVTFAPSYGVSGPSNVLINSASGDAASTRKPGGYGFTVPLAQA